MTALVRPEYTPRNPPEAAKPALDCMRVLRVSRGNRAVSTAVPAMAPAYFVLDSIFSMRQVKLPE